MKVALHSHHTPSLFLSKQRTQIQALTGQHLRYVQTSVDTTLLENTFLLDTEKPFVVLSSIIFSLHLRKFYLL